MWSELLRALFSKQVTCVNDLQHILPGFYSELCVVSTRCVSERIMADLRTVSREFLTELIQAYREYPCLWKVKSKEYSDRV